MLEKLKPDYKTISSKMIHEGFLSLRLDHLKKEDDTSLFYHVLLAGCDAVAILAIDPKGNFILNREYRHPIQKAIIGCPGGRIEKDEEIFTCAKRELIEETGYHTDQWYHMGSSYCFPSVCEQKIHYVLALQAKKSNEPHLDPFECIETIIYNQKDIYQKILTSKEIDSVLCSALLYYHIFEKPSK